MSYAFFIINILLFVDINLFYFIFKTHYFIQYIAINFKSFILSY